LQVSRLNHISAASGVAYAETCGATTLPNWTEVGLKPIVSGLWGNAFIRAMWLCIVGMSGEHANPSVNSRRVAKSKCLVWCRLPGKTLVFQSPVGLLGLPKDKMIAASVQAR
jgi:hypothetical protein